MSLNLVMTGPKSNVDISEQAIRDELSRLLESPIFVQSYRLSRFLRFTVETTLAGQAEALKEYLIGMRSMIAGLPITPAWIPLSAARRADCATN